MYFSELQKKGKKYMIDIYLCEDEKIQLLCLSAILDKYIRTNNINARIVSARLNPQETLSDLSNSKTQCSLFFIDVQLDGASMDGFDLARKIRKSVPECYLVFLTSKEELAYQAFELELEALDYIIKRPEYFLDGNINTNLKKRLDKVFEKAGSDLNGSQEKSGELKVKCGSRLIDINIKDVVFVQAVQKNHQIEIVMVQQKIKIRETLKNIFEMLGEGFMYISKSCIVAENKIREIDKKNRFVTLEGGYRLEISYREIKNVAKILQ